MKKEIMILATLLLAAFQVVVAQCKIDNTYFKEGEVLTYDMYFKYGISTKAGVLSLSVQKGDSSEKGDYKIKFQSNTSGLADKLYAVHDTLYSYMSKDIVPQVYIKNAMEGGAYTQEELYYTYKADGKVDVRTKRTRHGDFKFDEVLTSDACIYDMVSVVYYARTLDFANMKKGDKTSINFISGRKISNIDIIYNGQKRVKGNDGKKYDTSELKLIFAAGDAEYRGKEMMKVYITNDKNRIPIEIQTSLKKMGAIHAVIKSKKGLRNVE